MDSYDIKKTLKKAGVPAFIIAIINAALYLAKQNGIDIDESKVWEVALGGYGSWIALVNWIKNRKKKE
jgi:hypothetical protein